MKKRPSGCNKSGVGKIGMSNQRNFTTSNKQENLERILERVRREMIQRERSE